ncbi:MAG: cyclic nucleotide-binding domain-containing protein, partial [Candidatus Omnitrophica bacterium]|nr:cyclic nucleotide-binding domain-containing protein [Candidatus Omnitrophota bacterium]
MDKSEITLIVSNTPTFNKLSSADIEEFIALSELKEYKNGEIVYREGAPGDYFYFLLKGRIIALTTAAGRESEIDLLKRGTSFGIISIFTDEPHSVTTRSIESSYILRIPKDRFKDFINTHPPISLDFSRMLSQRVRAKTALVPKRIFQVKRIGVIGFPSAGKTTYLYNLGRQLAEETNKNVICIEVSSSDNFILPYLGKFEASPLALSEFREEDAGRFVATGLVDCLLLKVLSPGNFSALINFLSEQYHFILYEIPFSFWDSYFDDFTSLADHIHFLLFPQIEELRRAGILLDALKAK